MHLTTEDRGDARILRVHAARIDAAEAIRFKDAMRAAAAGSAAPVLLELSEVEFVDSSGLGAIVAAMKSLGPGRRLDLVGLSPNVDKVFRLTRMDSIFSIHANLDMALAAHAARAG